MAGWKCFCPYCKAQAVTQTGLELYGRPDLEAKKFYVCVPCGAWVGAHDSDGAPLGTMANKALREARQRAHRIFDPLWNSAMPSGVARSKTEPPFYRREDAYAWLATKMGIPVRNVHFAHFDEATIIQAVTAMNPAAAALKKRVSIAKRSETLAKKKAAVVEEETSLPDKFDELARLLGGG